MNDREQLRQQLWELIYGLLEADEVARLHARIKSDPAAARMYAEVRLQADLVADAAKVGDATVTLQPLGGKGSPQAKRPSHQRASARPNAARRSVNWLAGLAATALAALLMFGLFAQQPSADHLLADFAVTEVHVPAQLQAGLTQSVPVLTTNLQDQPQVAQVELRVVDAHGRERFRTTTETDRDGRGAFKLPGEIVQDDLRLEVAATSRQTALTAPPSPVSVEVPVTQELVTTYLLFDKPAYEPGETVKFAVQEVTRFSKNPITDAPENITVQTVEGAEVPEPKVIADRARNVVTGEFKVPEKSDYRDVELALNESRGQLARQNYFNLEGEQRSAAQPTAPFGRGLQRQAALAERKPSAAADQPKAKDESLARRNFEDAERSQSLRSELAERGSSRPGAAEVPAEPSQYESLAATSNLVAAGQPLAVTIPAEYRQNRLQVTAQCADVVVAAKEIPPAQDEAETKTDAYTVLLRPAPEVDGEIFVAVQNLDTEPATVIDEQIFFREPQKQLTLKLPDNQTTFQPGEQVSLDVQTVDERGDPVPATLAVRVWNDRLVQSRSTSPPQLTSVVFQNNAAPGFVDELAAGAPLDSDNPASMNRFALGARMTDDSPATTFGAAAVPESRSITNRAEVQSLFNQSLAQARSAAADQLETLGRALLLGGLALLVLLGLQWLVRSAPSNFVAIPAGAVAAASLALGIAWLNPSWPKFPTEMIARAPTATPQAASEPATSDRANSPASGSSDAPLDAAAPSAKPSSTLGMVGEEQSGMSPAPAESQQNGAALAPKREASRSNRLADAAMDTKSLPADKSELAATPPPAPARPATDAAALPSVTAPSPAGAFSAQRGAGNAGSATQPRPRLSKSMAGKAPGGESLNEAADEKKTAQGKQLELSKTQLAAKADLEPDDRPAAPASLYFNPALVTNDQGQATIEFQLPPAESDYRILIDAIGQGRVGSTQFVIQSRQE